MTSSNGSKKAKKGKSVAKHNTYPVIDLFAGPGGLGEGFASLRHPKNKGNYAFKTAISIEKDPHAHTTLQLRHFFREFQPEKVTDDYYHYLQDKISREELYLRHPKEAAMAQQTAWQCTLGEEPHATVKKRITKALNKNTKWALVGGPPCQAYSLVGRSRMMGNPEFESDPRHFLYREYLQILAEQKPPVFVMENVKGLLSAKVKGDYVINHILRDLSDPARAVFGNNSGLGYKLYSLSESGLKNTDTDPTSFTIKAEEYGIPQARHRIFIVGIRSDIDIRPASLEKSEVCTVKQVLGGMPALRSGISKSEDSENLWKEALSEIIHQPWYVKGKTNGLAEFSTATEKMLLSLSRKKLTRSSQSYSMPKNLQSWLGDERLSVLSSHESRSHMRSDLHRYFFASLYAKVNNSSPKLSDFPAALLPNHKNVELGITGKMFSDRFRVQLPDAPATTITSHISKDGHYFIHYDPLQCRSLTVREAARLQTFPDNYKFEGNRTAQYHQVGNAVPPLLANKIAEIIYQVLEGIK